MADLIELLESFNRKERYFLISHALGNFQLSDDFRRKLSKEIGLRIPGNAYAAMDYHLDWLIAALHAHQRGNVDDPFNNPERKLVKGNQEDIDLLVAFKDNGKHHLVLVEVKGATGWINKQLKSKADRLSLVFGPEGNCHPGVEPHFCLASPNCPQHLEASEWPKWMSKGNDPYFWIKLKFPKCRKKVTRCESSGRPSAKGNYFKITAARY